MIRSEGSEQEAVDIALQKGAELAWEIGEDAEVILLVPTKRVAGTTLAQALGDKAIRCLEQDGFVTVSGMRLGLESQRTYRSRRCDVVIGIYPTRRMLNMIDDSQVKAVVIVPWSMTETQDWIGTWAPSFIGGLRAAEPVSGMSPLVEESLGSLTRRVNLSTGLGHPNDRAAAQEILRRLKKVGENLDPVEIRRWAARNGWSSGHADDLKELAERESRTKSTMLKKPHMWNDSIIEILKEAATKRITQFTSG